MTLSPLIEKALSTECILKNQIIINIKSEMKNSPISMRYWRAQLQTRCLDPRPLSFYSSNLTKRIIDSKLALKDWDRLEFRFGEGWE
jgi:hypothetical protein